MTSTNPANLQKATDVASSSTPTTSEQPAQLTFIDTRAHARFVEFAEACTTYRYIGVCHGRPGVGKTRSASEYAAFPDMTNYSASQPLSDPLATEVARCRAFFYTAPVANTPKKLDDSMMFNLLRFGHVRLSVEGSMDPVKAFTLARRGCPLVIVDEADRLTIKSLEHLRDLYDRHGFGLILLGMPGLEKRLARYAQLYSRIGFVHEFKSLSESEIRFILDHHDDTFGLRFDPECLEDVEALAAVIRITRGNFRLMERLFAQMRRIMDVNHIDAVSLDVVDAARDCLVIGPGD